jgi:hypothetical protein
LRSVVDDFADRRGVVDALYGLYFFPRGRGSPLAFFAAPSYKKRRIAPDWDDPPRLQQLLLTLAYLLPLLLPVLPVPLLLPLGLLVLGLLVLGLLVLGLLVLAPPVPPMPVLPGVELVPEEVPPPLAPPVVMP